MDALRQLQLDNERKRSRLLDLLIENAKAERRVIEQNRHARTGTGDTAYLSFGRSLSRAARGNQS